jgi:hypothetical protein
MGLLEDLHRMNSDATLLRKMGDAMRQKETDGYQASTQSSGHCHGSAAQKTNSQVVDLSSLRTRIIDAAWQTNNHDVEEIAFAGAATALQIARERLAECGSLHGMQQIDQLLDELDRRN